jgi:NADH-quinone oxidoreductase subunit B
MEVSRQPISAATSDNPAGASEQSDLRVRHLSARQMLRGAEVRGANPGLHPDQEGVSPPYEGGGGPAGEAFERHVEERVLTTTLERAVAWARSNSFFPATFGLACCAIEMMSIVAARVDVARFGFEAFRASPRQADLLILSGRVSIKMAPVIRRIYDQMLEPKWAISMGACCSSMGVFNNYALVPADKFMPIDVHVPGCPPRPEALMHGVLKLRSMVQDDPGAGWRTRYQAVGTEEVLPAVGDEHGRAVAVDVFRRGS